MGCDPGGMESSAPTAAPADLSWGAFTEDTPWVLDREHNGTAGVAVDASMHEVDVGCAGLTAR